MKETSATMSTKKTDDLTFHAEVLNFIYELRVGIEGFDKKKMSLKHLRQLLTNTAVKRNSIYGNGIRNDSFDIKNIKEAVIQYLKAASDRMGYNGLKDSRLGLEEFSNIIAEAKQAARLDRDLLINKRDSER